MLFCASKGDEIEGWKERGEKMREAKHSEPSRASVCECSVYLRGMLCLSVPAMSSEEEGGAERRRRGRGRQAKKRVNGFAIRLF